MARKDDLEELLEWKIQQEKEKAVKQGIAEAKKEWTAVRMARCMFAWSLTSTIVGAFAVWCTEHITPLYAGISAFLKAWGEQK